MSWIEIKSKPKIGDWIMTTKIHEDSSGKGYFEKGSLVQIIAIHPKDGYTISDISGNSVSKIGWII